MDAKTVDILGETFGFCDIMVVRDDFFNIQGVAPNYLGEALQHSFEGAAFQLALRVSGDNFPSKRMKVSCGWERGVKNLVAVELP